MAREWGQVTHFNIFLIQSESPVPNGRHWAWMSEARGGQVGLVRSGCHFAGLRSRVDNLSNLRGEAESMRERECRRSGALGNEEEDRRYSRCMEVSSLPLRAVESVNGVRCRISTKPSFRPALAACRT